MTDKNTRVICVGEVIVELSRGNDGRYGQCSAATFQHRLPRARRHPRRLRDGWATSYSALMALATAEGVNGISSGACRAHARPLPDRDGRQGGAAFYYWRGPRRRAVVRTAQLGVGRRDAAFCALVYFPASALSLYSNTGIRRFLAAGTRAQAGVKVAFDGNFRPRGWKGDVVRARGVHRGLEARRHCAADVRGRGDIVGDTTPGDSRASAGVRHRRIVAKNGSSTAGRGHERPRACASAGNSRADRHHGGGRTRSTPRIWRRG